MSVLRHLRLFFLPPPVRKQGAYAERHVVRGVRYEQLRSRLDVRLLCLAKVNTDKLLKPVFVSRSFFLVLVFRCDTKTSNFTPVSMPCKGKTDKLLTPVLISRSFSLIFTLRQKNPVILLLYLSCVFFC